MTDNLYPKFRFDIEHKDKETRARVGVIHTPHGDVQTPNFIFCGTHAAIKGAVKPTDLKAENVQLILSNTYHLMLRPGADLIEKMGGLHKFMGWDAPILTDSGGYQIFAMGHGSVAEEIKGNKSKRKKNEDCTCTCPDCKRRMSKQAAEGRTLLKIDENGAWFRSYHDGSKIHLTPEKSIEIQRKLGADIILQFDECTPFNVDKDYTDKSMRMSMAWGDRSLEEFKRHNDHKQAMYGIVQGGVYNDLRDISCNYINETDFFGIAVGGSLGNSVEEMHRVVAYTMSKLRDDRPVHLLGIGKFVDIFHGVRQGIDTFDCVDPTRRARHGYAKVKGAPKEEMNLRNTQYKDDSRVIDETCDCHACKNGYSRSYLHNMVRMGEDIGGHLITLHNINTMTRLMSEIRQAIKDNTLDVCENDWLGKDLAERNRNGMTLGL